MRLAANFSNREKAMVKTIVLLSVLLLIFVILFLNCVKQIVHLENQMNKNDSLVQKEIQELSQNDEIITTELLEIMENEEETKEKTNESEEEQTTPTVEVTYSTEVSNVQSNVPEKTEPQVPSVSEGNKEENEGNEDFFE